MSRIEQTIDLPVSRERLFEAIADSTAHTAFTGQPAEIGQAPGEPWSAFGGKIHGVQIDRQEGARVVQAWRSAEWPDGVYSLVHFSFEDRPEGGRIRLVHSAIPEGARSMLEQGWNDMYWNPLREWLRQD